jgi:CRP-like cAMP-binding protein
MDLKQSRNLLIQRMSDADRQRLGSYFVEQRVDFKQTLLEQDRPIEYVYFIEAGVMSMVTDLLDGEAVETGTVGNEGLVGLPAVLGVALAPGRIFAQIAGRSLRVPASVIAAESAAGTSWFQLLLRYANFVTAMMAQSAACNRMHPVNARASRWLLMTHDRVEGDEFPLTQEFLAQMLGVARPTVNMVGATLQKAGLITYSRGRITVLHRAGLERAACECYVRIRTELAKALGADLSSTLQTARHQPG